MCQVGHCAFDMRQQMQLLQSGTHVDVSLADVGEQLLGRFLRLWFVRLPKSCAQLPRLLQHHSATAKALARTRDNVTGFRAEGEWSVKVCHATVGQLQGAMGFHFPWPRTCGPHHVAQALR